MKINNKRKKEKEKKEKNFTFILSKFAFSLSFFFLFKKNVLGKQSLCMYLFPLPPFPLENQFLIIFQIRSFFLAMPVLRMNMKKKKKKETPLVDPVFFFFFLV